MKIRKSLVIIGLIVMSISFTVGCSSRNEDVNKVSGDVIERLPEDQKDTEIDKALAKIRKERKESVTVKNGALMMTSNNGMGLTGQSKNIPRIQDMDEIKKIVNTVRDYLENELKLPKRGIGEYDTSTCLDPRMNAIYDDEDKGVANGYDNENIYIEEYETAEDGVYSYLILVRDSKDSEWKVIHDGNSYKK
ncbi:MAG: hypothetical protein ACRCYC_10535 [Paraclostridium sp.]|uniref:hypothetical protein n=1 Tax=Paraclostridium sp. TaxID=2023273 RepID=UPI003F2A3645